MIGYNCIVVYSADGKSQLFCRRIKEPYLGLYNFVGGHIEEGESSEDAAYRELLEETGIEKNDIVLRHLMDFTYYNQDCYMEVWCGRLRGAPKLIEGENPLEWLDFNHDFFDINKFAGEGNIGHIIEQIKQFGEGFMEPSGKGE